MAYPMDRQIGCVALRMERADPVCDDVPFVETDKVSVKELDELYEHFIDNQPQRTRHVLRKLDGTRGRDYTNEGPKTRPPLYYCSYKFGPIVHLLDEYCLTDYGYDSSMLAETYCLLKILKSIENELSTNSNYVPGFFDEAAEVASRVQGLEDADCHAITPPATPITKPVLIEIGNIYVESIKKMKKHKKKKKSKQSSEYPPDTIKQEKDSENSDHGEDGEDGKHSQQIGYWLVDDRTSYTDYTQYNIGVPKDAKNKTVYGIEYPKLFVDYKNGDNDDTFGVNDNFGANGDSAGGGSLLNVDIIDDFGMIDDFGANGDIAGGGSNLEVDNSRIVSQPLKKPKPRKLQKKNGNDSLSRSNTVLKIGKKDRDIKMRARENYVKQSGSTVTRTMKKKKKSKQRNETRDDSSNNSSSTVTRTMKKKKKTGVNTGMRLRSSNSNVNASFDGSMGFGVAKITNSNSNSIGGDFNHVEKTRIGGSIVGKGILNSKQTSFGGRDICRGSASFNSNSNVGTLFKSGLRLDSKITNSNVGSGSTLFDSGLRTSKNSNSNTIGSDFNNVANTMIGGSIVGTRISFNSGMGLGASNKIGDDVSNVENTMIGSANQTSFGNKSSNNSNCGTSIDVLAISPIRGTMSMTDTLRRSSKAKVGLSRNEYENKKMRLYDALKQEYESYVKNTSDIYAQIEDLEMEYSKAKLNPSKKK